MRKLGVQGGSRGWIGYASVSNLLNVLFLKCISNYTLRHFKMCYQNLLRNFSIFLTITKEYKR